MKKDYGQPTSNFRLLLVVFGFSFYCLFVYSVQALCTCSVSSSPFFVISSTYRQEYELKRVNLPRKTGKKVVLVCVDVA